MKSKGSDVEGADNKDHLAWCVRQLKETGLDKEWIAVTPSDHELFIDLDTPEQETTFLNQMLVFHEHWPKAQVKITPSKSGKKHVIITLHEPLPYEWRVSLQACLGSDPKRELLHLVSQMKGEINNIVLIEKKVKSA